MSDWIAAEAPIARERIVATLRARHTGAEKRLARYAEALEPEFELLFRLFHRLYGWRYDFAWHLESLIGVAAQAALERAKWLRKRDRTRDDGWLSDHRSIWAMAYVDRFTGDIDSLERALPHLESLGITHLHLMPPYATPEGPADGGYAVSDYRRVRADLGTMKDLQHAIRALDTHGIAVALDLVANHTADNHPWAEAAKAGDPVFQRYYLMFDDRTQPNRYATHLRAIFPDRGGDAFTWRADAAGPAGGKWVWTTFHSYQWDLDYRNPEVLTAMTRELLGVVNLGASVIRIDATPFLWKAAGTDCENQPEVHTVLQIMSAVVRVVAPSVQLLSEAIVHPDAVRSFVRPDECRIGYNPLVMATTWEALATRDVRLLATALSHRSRLDQSCQWISYLRCHDDIGWGFADEDARELGIDPAGHRRYLVDFYAGDFPGSFATGFRFQEDPVNGDARTSGTLASLAGLEQAVTAGDPAAVDMAVRRILALHAVLFSAVGMPMVYLGDEIGQLNDHGFQADPSLAADNRWAHRPRFDWVGLASADQGIGPGGAILAGIRRLVRARKATPALGPFPPVVIDSGHPSVLAMRRRAEDVELLVAVNLSESSAAVVLGPEGEWTNALDPEAGPFRLPPTLGPYDYLILTREV